MPTTHMSKAQTITEAVHYLLSRIGETDKEKIADLLYLADKYHLTRYGRTVTGDDYFIEADEQLEAASQDQSSTL